jgi:hypothetical protein
MERKAEERWRGRNRGKGDRKNGRRRNGETDIEGK